MEESIVKEHRVLGLGNNIDYEIQWDSQVIESLIEKYEIRNEEIISQSHISTERELLLSILSFLKSGCGKERFVENGECIESFAEKFSKKVTLGGTSVRAGLAMEKLGYDCTLHLVTFNKTVKELLPKNCKYLYGENTGKTYPHLIIQFTKGTMVKVADVDICTATANRVIYSNDQDNMEMKLAGKLGEYLEEAKVFLISGFNAMQEKEKLRSRLRELQKAMDHLEEDAIVFYEDACYFSQELNEMVREALVSKINIYSMNEDELQDYLSHPINLLNPYDVVEALEEIHKKIPVPYIVIHTGKWALVYGKNAKQYRQALHCAMTTASTRFSYGDDFTLEEYKKVSCYPVQKEGRKFAVQIEELLKNNVCCLACVQSSEERATTIGLGDAFVGGFLTQLPIK